MPPPSISPAASFSFSHLIYIHAAAMLHKQSHQLTEEVTSTFPFCGLNYGFMPTNDVKKYG